MFALIDCNKVPGTSSYEITKMIFELFTPGWYNPFKTI